MADDAFRMLVDGQAAARVRLAQATSNAVVAILRGLNGKWYDDSATGAAAVQLAAHVRRGQVATGALTGAYLARVLALQGLTRRLTPVSLPDSLRAVDPVEQWRRPAVAFRWLVSQGMPANEAEAQAVLRATRMADMDMGLAMREASRQTLTQVPEVRGQRRTVHPEFARSGGSCALCVGASSQVFPTGELMPLHTGCGCVPVPVFDGADPAASLNRSAIGGEVPFAERPRVEVHDELGPMFATS